MKTQLNEAKDRLYEVEGEVELLAERLSKAILTRSALTDTDEATAYIEELGEVIPDLKKYSDWLYGRAYRVGRELDKLERGLK